MKPPIDDLVAFATVVRAGSFTRAAALLGMSQPALSRTIRTLEVRLGVRLLNRTTRSLSPTQAGAALMADLQPALDMIGAAMERVAATRDEPTGVIRLTADRQGYDLVLAGVLPEFLATHPGISAEVSLTDAFVDPVAMGFDGGLRLADMVERDMIALRMGPEVAFAVVGSPDYWKAAPPRPTSPADLARHSCIAYRKPRTGEVHAWRFERKGRRLSVQIEGQLILNDGAAILTAALAGTGLAYLLEHEVADYLDAGRLSRVLADWCPALPGYRLYYPDRHRQPAAMAAFIRHINISEASRDQS